MSAIVERTDVIGRRCARIQRSRC